MCVCVCVPLEFPLNRPSFFGGYFFQQTPFEPHGHDPMAPTRRPADPPSHRLVQRQGVEARRQGAGGGAGGVGLPAWRRKLPHVAMGQNRFGIPFGYEIKIEPTQNRRF